MITFYSGIDNRARHQAKPTVARFEVTPGKYAFIVIGTEYGHIHTSSGDVRTWASRSGAQRAASRYVSF
jgi:hypothetical protein